MARHKVYLTAQGFGNEGKANNPCSIGGRNIITKYNLVINSDINAGTDIEGYISIKHVDGEVIIDIDCPEFGVIITGAKEVL